ncbi:MAG TPA: hypothetical protein VN281_24065, partial [Verrucomicrobiae bacterium]|nr:hypothetical protein [Verrucomicrobiae bacterium]
MKILNVLGQKQLRGRGHCGDGRHKIFDPYFCARRMSPGGPYWPPNQRASGSIPNVYFLSVVQNR